MHNQNLFDQIRDVDDKHAEVELGEKRCFLDVRAEVFFFFRGTLYRPLFTNDISTLDPGGDFHVLLFEVLIHRDVAVGAYSNGDKNQTYSDSVTDNHFTSDQGHNKTQSAQRPNKDGETVDETNSEYLFVCLYVVDTKIPLHSDNCMGNHGNENRHWDNVNKEIGKSTVMVGVGDLKDVCSIYGFYERTDKKIR